MDKNVKMTLGCIGIVTTLVVAVLGRKINEQNTETQLDGDLSKQFEELKKQRRETNKYYIFNRNRQ